MTNNTAALQERIARAMWDHDHAHMSQQWRDMAWDDMGGSEPSDERMAYLLRAVAVLPIIAAEVRKAQADAAREALDGLAEHANRTANERRSPQAVNRWDDIWRETRKYRATHYPETEDQT